MKKRPAPAVDTDDLRRRAEQLLEQQPATTPRVETHADTQRILQELQIFQIELELQNEELKQSKAAVEFGLEKYTDLYDFAPVGYFSIDEQGLILEVNLTGAVMLGTERALLTGRRLQLFVEPPSRPTINAFLESIFAGHEKQACEASLLNGGSNAFWADLRAMSAITFSGARKWCRVAVIDASARKRIAEALREKAWRLRYATEAARLTYVELDLVRRTSQTAENFPTVMGYVSPAEQAHDVTAGTRALLAHVVPEDRPSVEAALKDWLGGRPAGKIDYRVLGDDQIERWIESRWSVEAGADGKPVKSFATNLDITERKHAEEASRASEERYRTLFTTIDEAFCTVEVLFDKAGHPFEHRFLEANPAFEKHTGLKNPVGRLGRELVPDLEPKWTELYGRVVTTGQPERAESWEQGLKRWFDIYVSRIGGVGSRKVAIVFTDITARRQAEEALRKSEQHLSLITQHAPVAILHLDAEQRLRFANPAYLKLRRKRPEEILGKTMRAIAGPANYAKLSPYLTKAFTGVPQSYEVRIAYPVIGARDLHVHHAPIRDAAGKVQGLVSLIEDVTERKRAERALRRADLLAASNAKLKKEIVRRRRVETSLKQSERRTRELLEESQDLQEKLRQMSHRILKVQEDQRKEISRELHDKISQLLIGINVRLGIFTQEAALNPRGIRRSIGPIRRLVGKSVDVVHQFARELRPAMLDDLGLIPALASHIDRFRKQEGLEIQFAAYAGVEALSNDKRTALYRVAQEALVNVAKHAHARVVKVFILKAPGGACLEVSDDGKAFPVDRFGSAAWGNRLGLVGMRERMEMVGGHFSVESAPGQGTTIRAVVSFRGSKRRN